MFLFIEFEIVQKFERKDIVQKETQFDAVL